MGDLGGGQFGGTTQLLSPPLRRLQSGLGAFDDQAALEFRQCAYDVHDQAATRARRVDRIGQASEAISSPPEFGDQGDEVRKRPAKPVELPDDEGVTGREGGEDFGQSRPLGARSRDGVGEDFICTRQPSGRPVARRGVGRRSRRGHSLKACPIFGQSNRTRKLLKLDQLGFVRKWAVFLYSQGALRSTVRGNLL